MRLYARLATAGVVGLACLGFAQPGSWGASVDGAGPHVAKATPVVRTGQEVHLARTDLWAYVVQTKQGVALYAGRSKSTGWPPAGYFFVAQDSGLAVGHFVSGHPRFVFVRVQPNVAHPKAPNRHGTGTLTVGLGWRGMVAGTSLVLVAGPDASGEPSLVGTVAGRNGPYRSTYLVGVTDRGVAVGKWLGTHAELIYRANNPAPAPLGHHKKPTPTTAPPTTAPPTTAPPTTAPPTTAPPTTAPPTTAPPTTAPPTTAGAGAGATTTTSGGTSSAVGALGQGLVIDGIRATLLGTSDNAQPRTVYDNLPQSSEMFDTATIRLTNLSTSDFTGSSSASVIIVGTNHKTYMADMDYSVANCNDFGSGGAAGAIDLPAGATQVGCVHFIVPVGANVAMVGFSPYGQWSAGDYVAWLP